MTPEAITSDWLSAVLGDEVRITDTSRIGDGLVGMNLRIALDRPAASGLPPTIVAKLPSPDPTSRAAGLALRTYEREVKFYAEIVPTVDIRVARCFHGEWHADEGDFVLLLEDLAPCRPGDQIEGCGAEHAQVAVVELARLHGPRWGDPTLADVEFLQRSSDDQGAQLQALWGMFVPGFVATFGPYLDSEGIALVERFGERLPAWLAGRTLPDTVTHGDYRLDNLMFASEQGGYPVAAVDWQTPGHGPASGDVSYFLGAGPLPESRREIERDLVADYCAALAGYGVAVDEGEFWQQYCRDAYSGIIMTVVASQVVGKSDRSEAMFAAMATRHIRHALDLASESLI
jgi:hypothetical protein